MIPLVALPQEGLALVQCGICFAVIHSSRVDDHGLWHTAIDAEPPTDATIEPEFETTDRGFKRLAPIPGARYGSVRIYESSNAEEACIWVKVAQPEDLNRWPRSNTDPQIEAMTELTIDHAAALRDQLDWLITNHYQAED